MKFTNRELIVAVPSMYAPCSSFPPFTWELAERAYPNRLIAASQDEAAIHAAAWLYAAGSKL